MNEISVIRSLLNEIDERDKALIFDNELAYEKINILIEENKKLQSLILLTDPAVSGTEMNETSVKQWSEYRRYINDRDKN